MTLPTFLGIAAPRSGTTWLHGLLESHPDVYVPSRRKEIAFFNVYYHRGLDWYSGFFPTNEAIYREIGEFTPHYFYCSRCPQRIKSVPSITKFLLILRNPIDRAFSHYKHRMRIDNYSKPFEEFLQEYPEVVQLGFYARYLQRYLSYFAQAQFEIFIYEHAVNDSEATKHRLARFLGLSWEKFPVDSGSRIVNQSFIPKHGWAYAIAAKVARQFQKHDLDWITYYTKRLGIRYLFGEKSVSPMRKNTRHYLRDLYARDISELESRLSTDLSHWN